MQITKKIIGLIIGFPIVCCGILMYTRYKETKKLTEELNTSTFAIVQCIDDLRDYLRKGDINADQ